MNIKKNDLVLEIGSGNNPNPRSDILADRFLSNNSERGDFSLVVDRPTVICDGYTLPFADNSFDYVICAHIIEHMDDPQRFADEVMRVGKRGYIEVPNILGERLFGWDFHGWYCTFEKDTLIMHKKREGVRFGGFFHMLYKDNLWFRRLVDRYNEKFYIRYEWKGKINLQVKHTVPSTKELNEVDKELWSLLQRYDGTMMKSMQVAISFFWERVQRKSKKIVRKGKWIATSTINKKRKLASIIPLLRCIMCYSKKGVSIDNRTKQLICRNCHMEYAMDGFIPVMLTEKERKKGY